MKSCGDSLLVECPEPFGRRLFDSDLPAPRLHKGDWVVDGCDISTARGFVERYHYARGASNTATYLHGLFPAGYHWAAELMGVAWWLPPTKNAAKSLVGDDWRGVLSLSRLCVSPEAPRNSCSFMLARSVRGIDRSKWHTLVTYADGWRGHAGTIYLASGWQYDGETSPERTYTLNGRMLARKAGKRTRTHQEMIDLGCVVEGRFSKHRFVKRL